MITFKDLPDTTTPLNAANLNNNFNECNNIVESGSNANGKYIKFSDGTMICTKKWTGTVDIVHQLDNVYYEGIYAQAGNLPQNFTEVYATFVNVINEYETWSSTYNSATSTSWPARIDVFSPRVRNGINITIDMMAIGKWN